MEQHHNNPDPSHVYHGRGRGTPWLVAFCADGLSHHDYFPHALDDDIVYAWGVRVRDGGIALYLLPDPANGGASVAGPFTTIDEAHDHCIERFGHLLRLVWL